ncbi:MAG: hypothetical protein GQ570_03910 [Helicobacteraceae bacterium]|nr:hypothetical protein [Helicobacteraceae bacterium]
MRHPTSPERLAEQEEANRIQDTHLYPSRVDSGGPYNNERSRRGITIRDQLAMNAMSSLITSGETNADEVARKSYKLADAMIKRMRDTRNNQLNRGE